MSRITHDICEVVEPFARRTEIKGWVFYDADCGFCTRLAKRFEHLLGRRDFTLLPLQTPWVMEKFGVTDARDFSEMRLLRADGAEFGGADALVEIARHYWWAWPFCQTARFQAVKKMLRKGYGRFAARRHCAEGECGIQKATARKENLQFADFLPLLILTAAALICRNHVEAWAFMWLMAFALYAGCKWLTFRQAERRGVAASFPRRIGYLLAWPGMDAPTFLDTDRVPLKPRGTEWTSAIVKTIFGIFLLWGTTRRFFPAHPMIAGWIGMTGVVFILHFGLFHILSLAWRQAGVAAEPLMRAPILSKSLAEFWGRRWNTAYNELAFRFTFRPLRRLTSAAVGTVLVFGLSGLVHDLVISVPARGGYGWPTAYFLIEGAGLVAQRSKTGRHFGLDRGALGWLSTMLVAAGPAPCLFHRPFVTKVILPMLTRIGAI